MTDSERLDFLDSLLKRTEYQNKRRPTVSVDSDMHFINGDCLLFIRDLFGKPIARAYATNVRDAIDMAGGEYVVSQEAAPR